MGNQAKSTTQQAELRPTFGCATAGSDLGPRPYKAPNGRAMKDGHAPPGYTSMVTQSLVIKSDGFGAPRKDETASCVAGVQIHFLNSKGIAAISPGLRKNNDWYRSDHVIFLGLTRPLTRP
jgi:hypothetical protein